MGRLIIVGPHKQGLHHTNMSETNQHGLSRSIDAATKREVRRRCGFGCVNCGGAVYQYEHLDPVFSDAKFHDPAAIVLLCGGCHDRVTRGLLSKETVKRCAASPKCKEQGFSFGPLDVGEGSVDITIGTATFEDVTHLIQVAGDNVFSLTKPDEAGAPLNLNAYVCDRDGTEILRIVDNEWRTPTTNWDVEIIGKRISIRKAQGDIALVFRAESPNHLVVERLNMLHKGIRIECEENKHITITTTSAQKFYGTRLRVKGCVVGAVITDGSISFGSGGGSVGFSGSFSLRSTPSARQHPSTKAPTQTARNSVCPCGSGVRYKQCCGRLA